VGAVFGTAAVARDGVVLSRTVTAVRRTALPRLPRRFARRLVGPALHDGGGLRRTDAARSGTRAAQQPSLGHAAERSRCHHPLSFSGRGAPPRFWQAAALPAARDDLRRELPRKPRRAGF